MVDFHFTALAFAFGICTTYFELALVSLVIAIECCAQKIALYDYLHLDKTVYTYILI